MKPLNVDEFEKELRRLKAAPASPEFLSRLEASATQAQPERGESRHELPLFERWRSILLWSLAPAAAVCVAGIMWLRPETRQTAAQLSLTNAPAIQAATASSDNKELEIDRDLVDSYEVVTDLPTGVPVRFRLDQWQDTVVYRDKTSGLAVERRVPRFEVVPVRFESY